MVRIQATEQVNNEHISIGPKPTEGQSSPIIPKKSDLITRRDQLRKRLDRIDYQINYQTSSTKLRELKDEKFQIKTELAQIKIQLAEYKTTLKLCSYCKGVLEDQREQDQWRAEVAKARANRQGIPGRPGRRGYRGHCTCGNYQTQSYGCIIS